MPTVDAVFDWTRIFVGSTPWTFHFEIVLRTAIMYLFTLCLLRMLGKRGMGELSPFEFVIIIALGSSVGDPMFYPHVPVTHAMVVLTVVVILQRMLLGLAHRHHRVEVAVKSETQVLVKDGRVLVESLSREKYSCAELFMILRESGVEQLGEVQRAYLEPSGKVSVFRFEKEKIQAGLSLIPPSDELYSKECRRAGSRVEGGRFFSCCYCGNTLRIEAGNEMTRCSNCAEDNWRPASLHLLE